LKCLRHHVRGRANLCEFEAEFRDARIRHKVGALVHEGNDGRLFFVEPSGVAFLQEQDAVEVIALEPYKLVARPLRAVHCAVGIRRERLPQPPQRRAAVVRPVGFRHRLALNLESLRPLVYVALSVDGAVFEHAAPFNAEFVGRGHVDDFKQDRNKRARAVVLVEFRRFPPCDLARLATAAHPVKPCAAQDAAVFGRAAQDLIANKCLKGSKLIWSDAVHRGCS
tara:strand:+ start:766 stop:1437 length:672 start_codon:yes stop_codon:yes gene_type:complete